MSKVTCSWNAIEPSELLWRGIVKRLAQCLDPLSSLFRKVSIETIRVVVRVGPDVCLVESSQPPGFRTEAGHLQKSHPAASLLC